MPAFADGHYTSIPLWTRILPSVACSPKRADDMPLKDLTSFQPCTGDAGHWRPVASCNFDLLSLTVGSNGPSLSHKGQGFIRIWRLVLTRQLLEGHGETGDGDARETRERRRLIAKWRSILTISCSKDVIQSAFVCWWVPLNGDRCTHLGFARLKPNSKNVHMVNGEQHWSRLTFN